MLVCKESEEEIARRYYLFLKLFHNYKDTLFYKLVKRNFTEKTGIKRYDLVIGLLACE